MSGIVSGITKVFSAVGSSVAKVGKAVVGVGASLFSSGAASGAGSMASGGLSGVVQSVTGSGVLGNILTGAITTAGYGALIGGAVGALTGQGFGKGALMGGLGGAALGGLSGAMGGGLLSSATPTGLAPTGSTAATTLPSPSSPAGGAMAASGGLGLSGSAAMSSAPSAIPSASAPAAAAATGGTGNSGLMGFLNSNVGGMALAGIGEGMMQRELLQVREDERLQDREWQMEDQQRRTDSHNAVPRPVGQGASGGMVAATGPQSFRYEYSSQSKRIERVPA